MDGECIRLLPGFRNVMGVMIMEKKTTADVVSVMNHDGSVGEEEGCVRGVSE